MDAHITPHMTMEQYRAHDGVSASDLKNLQRSPAYAHMKEHTTTPAQEWGTAVHTAILEPHELEVRYRLEPQQPPDNGAKLWRATKLYKEMKAELLEQPDVEGVLSAEQMESLKWIQKRVKNSEIGESLYQLQGMREVSAFAFDDQGTLRKCRPDWLVPEAKLAIDVKTAADHRPFQFSRACHRFGYHISAAYYIDTLNMIPFEIEHFVFVVVNADPPHELAIYTLDNDAIEQGRHDYQELLAQWRDCAEMQKWPAGSSEIQELSLPSYAITYNEENWL